MITVNFLYRLETKIKKYTAAAHPMGYGDILYP